MTKKDYKAIARAIDLSTSGNGETLSKICLIESLITIMRTDNPRFDALKFKAACNGEKA